MAPRGCPRPDLAPEQAREVFEKARLIETATEGSHRLGGEIHRTPDPVLGARGPEGVKRRTEAE